MPDNKRVHVEIQGRVQGVFFRMETKRQAEACQVAGWVRNLPQGTVEAVFEGEKNAVDKMVHWCWQGPPGARVERVDSTEEAYTGEFQTFNVTS